MGKIIDILNQRFARLTVIQFIGKDSANNAIWLCQCECGKIVNVISCRLRSGGTQSCGCLRKELLTKRVTMHGHTRNRNSTPVYYTWNAMISRCTNKNRRRYMDYGGRGIKVCDRWLKFENFLKDMGNRPNGMTIDRIDNNGNYEPSNCQWATPENQSKNQRLRKTKTSKYKGVNWNSVKSRWIAQISINGKKVHIGTFYHEEEAMIAYNNKTKEFI